jgi:hypothetical protein
MLYPWLLAAALVIVSLCAGFVIVDLVSEWEK